MNKFVTRLINQLTYKKKCFYNITTTHQHSNNIESWIIHEVTMNIKFACHVI